MVDNRVMRHKYEIRKHRIAQKNYVHFNPALFHYVLYESVVKTVIMLP